MLVLVVLRQGGKRRNFQNRDGGTERTGGGTVLSISSGQQNLMKTYHNEANTGGITKIALKKILDFFGQRR